MWHWRRIGVRSGINGFVVYSDELWSARIAAWHVEKKKNCSAYTVWGIVTFFYALYVYAACTMWVLGVFSGKWFMDKGTGCWIV